MSVGVPFLDLAAQYDCIGAELEDAVLAVLRSGHYVLGPRVEAFERAFARTCGVEHAVAVNSGTTALVLALQALKIGPGDAVITVPMTFVATVAAIEQVGARPVLVDVDPDTRCMDPGQIEAAITPDVRAIMPVHLHGHPADMDAINAIAARHGLSVIEDAAQAHGARYKGRACGGLGQMAGFSFYPSKNLGAAGEAGCVVTNDRHLAETLRSLRDWGQEGRYNHVRKGTNARMDAIQGAALEVKLRHLEAWNEARRQHAATYNDRIHGAGLTLQGVRTPHTADDVDPVHHVYAIEVDARDAIRDSLATAGIGTNIHYPVPVHLMPAYQSLGYPPGSFPVAERLSQTLLSLPLYPEMTSAQIDLVVTALTHAMDVSEKARSQCRG